MNSALPPPNLGQLGGRGLVEVLDTLLSLSATELTRESEKEPIQPAVYLLATVTLIGEGGSGAIRLQVPEAFARFAADVLLGVENTESRSVEQINDLAGELCNMVAGRVATDLGREGNPCSLGIPEIVRLTPDLLHSPPAPDAYAARTDWSCKGHWITLEVRYHPRST